MNGGGMPAGVPITPVRSKRDRRREIVGWVCSVAVALVAVMLIRFFCFAVIVVSGSSMDPTLADGERLYVSLLSARINGYQRGDVVICHYKDSDHYCVKRLIGLPGETVEVQGGITYVNGVPLSEPYARLDGEEDAPTRTLGPGEYYVMGDNRAVSHDSRSDDVGAVTDLMGLVRFAIWPPDRVGIVN